MIIRLTSDYKNVNGLHIRKGDYAVDDPVLKGKGRYLVDNDIAEVVSRPVATETPAPPPPDIDDIPDYDSMTKDELFALVGGDVDDVTGTGANGNILKDDLIAWLHDNA